MVPCQHPRKTEGSTPMNQPILIHCPIVLIFNSLDCDRGSQISAQLVPKEHQGWSQPHQPSLAHLWEPNYCKHSCKWNKPTVRFLITPRLGPRLSLTTLGVLLFFQTSKLNAALSNLKLVFPPPPPPPPRVSLGLRAPK